MVIGAWRDRKTDQHFKRAVENLKDVIAFARIAIMQALYPASERVFNPDRKDQHWGKRKLKRDQ